MAGSWYLEVVDSRINYDEVLHCNQLISSQFAPVAADLSVTFDAEQIVDSYGFIDIPNTNALDCASIFQTLLADRTKPLSTYTASIIPSPLITTGNCDVINDTQQQCQVSMILQLGSRILRTTETVPGISRLDIWLELGAIVGAVQFVAWILNGGR